MLGRGGGHGGLCWRQAPSLTDHCSTPTPRLATAAMTLQITCISWHFA